MLKKYSPLLFLAPFLLLLDQLTKWLVVQRIPLGGSRSVIPGYFELVHVRNPGAAFSFLADWDHVGRNWFFYGIGSIAIVVLIAIYRQSRPDDRRLHIPLAMILSGAIGNLIDRLRYGEVIDFLRFHWRDKVADFDLFGKHFHFLLSWPSFNVADAAITVGGIMLAWYFLFHSDSVDKKIMP